MKRGVLWIVAANVVALSMLLVWLVLWKRPEPAKPTATAFPDFDDPTEDWVFDLEQALEPFRIGLMNMAAEQTCSIFTEDFDGPVPFDAPEALKVWGPFEIGTQIAGSGAPQARAAAFFEKFALVAECVIKVVDVAPGRDKATLAFDIDAVGPDGLRWEFKGSYEATLRGFRIARLNRATSRVSRATRPIFVDEDIDIPRDIACRHCAYKIPFAHLGGLAMGDFDGDGFVDLVVPRYGRTLLLHNNRGKGFTAQEIGPPLIGTGALALDYDNDGRLDILITGQCDGKNGCPGCAVVLLHNNGDGTFEDVTRKAGLTTQGHAYSACAADIDLDGNLDIFVVRYGGPRELGDHKLAYGTYAESFVNARDGEPDLLFRNNGDGTFTEIAAKAGVNDPGWGLACTFTDVNGDRLPDLYVVNDFGSNSLYINKGGCKFENVTNTSGAADRGFGMGVAVGDADGDGRLDLYVSNMYSTAGNRVLRSSKLPEDVRRVLMKASAGNTLLLARGEGRFESVDAGVSRAGWSWGCQFVDVDNDGHPDLHVANGFISGETRKDL